MRPGNHLASDRCSQKEWFGRRAELDPSIAEGEDTILPAPTRVKPREHPPGAVTEGAEQALENPA